MGSQFSKLNKLVASASLPPKLRTAADYVINNLDACRFLTATELAKAMNVSYSTVMRLAKTLGFGGYPEFQKFLRSAFDDNLESISDNIVVPAQRIDEIISRGPTAPVRDLVAAHVLTNIRNTLANNPESQFEKACEIILASGGKYILAERGSSSVASFLHLIMRQMIPHVYNYIGYGQNIFDFVSDIGKNDCVISVAFPRYSLPVTDATEMAKSQGANIILITNSVTSPLAHYADVVLTAQCTSCDYYNSYVAALMTAELLCAYLSRTTNYSNKDLLQRINNYTVKYGNY